MFICVHIQTYERAKTGQSLNTRLEAVLTPSSLIFFQSYASHKLVKGSISDYPALQFWWGKIVLFCPKLDLWNTLRAEHWFQDFARCWSGVQAWEESIHAKILSTSSGSIEKGLPSSSFFIFVHAELNDSSPVRKSGHPFCRREPRQSVGDDVWDLGINN